MKALPAETIRLLSSSQVITSVLNVVKELLENSLDAGASSVEVKLENYGLDRIEVRDDGCGIKAEDTPVMAVRHYTSKISCHQDLESLETYGFRGEALGSICAVSEVVLTTKTKDDDISTQYALDLTGRIISKKPSHLGQGTTVCVMRLFKNLPVRRQFYSNAKKCKEVLKKVQDLLMAYAIIKPELRVTFTHNKAVVWLKPRVSDRRRALLAVLGTVPTANLLPLQHRHQQPQIAIDGYFPKPGSDASTMSSSSSDRTFIFVNDRPVHHKDILKVIRQQYCTQHNGDSARYPTLMMSISIPASMVDVNLTPDKSQVMLHEKEAVLSAVEAMLVKLYGPQDNFESPPADNAVLPSDTIPSPQISAVDETNPGIDPIINQQKATLPKTSSCRVGASSPERPDVSSAMHCSEPTGISSLNHSANTSSSSSSEDWVINKSLCELDANPPLVHEHVLLSCAVETNQVSPAGSGTLEDLDCGLAGISAETWSKGQAFRDVDTGEPLEPVKVHRSAGPPGETKMEPEEGPGKNTLSNIVTEKMTNLTAYDLISCQAVRQPMSASAIFQQEIRPTILQEKPNASLKEVNLTMEEQWKNLKEEDRQKYEKRAERDANRYDLQSKRASERAARPSEPEKRPQGLKRKAPLSNQMILDQLFSSQPARKKSPSKPSRELPFSLATLRVRLRLPSRDSSPDPQPVRLVKRLPSHGAWVVTQAGKLLLFSPSRVEEALLFNQLLERNVLPTAPLETPIPLTDGVLGGAEYTSALYNMEKDVPEASGEIYFSDPRLLSNGFQIRMTAGSSSIEQGLEVSGIADGVPFLGVEDLKEILAAVVEKNATSVRETRPLKVISYLQGEAMRRIRQLPLCLSAEEVRDTLSRMKAQLGAGCETCIHGRPFFHHLIDIPEVEQDDLQIMSNFC